MSLTYNNLLYNVEPNDTSWQKIHEKSETDHIHSVNAIDAHGNLTEKNFYCRGSDDICLFCEATKRSRFLDEVIDAYKCSEELWNCHKGWNPYANWIKCRDKLINNWDLGLNAWGDPTGAYIKGTDD